MKTKWRFLVFCVILVAFYQNAFGENSGILKYHKYQMRSGIIEYVIEGQKTGVEVLYFDRWGMREVKYTKTKHPKFGRQGMVTLFDKDWTYTVDLDKRLGTKAENNLLKMYMQQVPAEDALVLTEKIIRDLGGEYIGQEKVLDKTCDVWDVEKIGTRYWFWRWIPLKTQIQFPQEEIVYRAINIEENVEVPESKFDIPSDIYFVDTNLEDIILSWAGHSENSFSVFLKDSGNFVDLRKTYHII